MGRPRPPPIMSMTPPIGVWAGVLIAFLRFSSPAAADASNVTYDGRALLINGERQLLISGSIHYPRSTPEMWGDLIAKSKEGGLDMIETYVFWDVHEPRRGEYNFEGNLDVIRFIKEIQSAGLYAFIRLGPYVCAEWNYGGIPAWLRSIPGMQFRTDNQPWKDEMQRFTSMIVNMLKNEQLFASQGGPIILAQIENEYGNIDWVYGDAGKRYIKWCANLAESFQVGVPWVMCQQGNAPQPMINTCNGFYCDGFTPNNHNVPKIWTENWTGWFKAWSKPDPHRPAEELAFSVARFYQLNGTLQNYYMYHGGTNFGRTSGGPYITTSYDYDAPLDEYGNIRQPKWGHLKELHASLKMMKTAILYGQFSSTQLGNNVWMTKYSGDGVAAGCFLSNTDQSKDATVSYQGNQFTVPAWSVSIIPDCEHEVYNTAKVTVQTSLMATKASGGAGNNNLGWSWRAEYMKDTLQGLRGTTSTNSLAEQIVTSLDQSDYIWYMTSLEMGFDAAATLQVNTQGHVLYAFVNGNLIGSKYAPDGPFSFSFQASASLKQGNNFITLLSATVGLTNYGGKYEFVPAGIAGGPVKLVGSNFTMDLSNNKWTYKIGLNGEDSKLYTGGPNGWNPSAVPTNRPFTWYAASFDSPEGTEPVVVDLAGMGKGEAWVNGNSIGRFWPSVTANNDGCGWCDRRRAYNADSECRTGCGGPTQRFYHVPRSFLNDASNNNTLVLFEEAGGDPSKISFGTVAVGTACADVEAGKVLSLSCGGGRTIVSVDFASFGNPTGQCGGFGEESCAAAASTDGIVRDVCVGKESCSIDTGDLEVDGGKCVGFTGTMRLTVQATCS